MTEYSFTLKFNFHDRVRVKLLILTSVSLNALLETVLAIRGTILQPTKPKLRDKGNFEAIVGKSVKADGTSKRFGGVHGYDTKPHQHTVRYTELAATKFQGLWDG